MAKMFKVYVETPNKERIYITTFRHMNQRLKDKVNVLRGQLYHMHSVVIVGSVNEIKMSTFRPMTKETTIECVDALAPYRRAAAQRLENLRRIRQGNVPARNLRMLPAKEIEAIVAEGRKPLRTKLAENIAAFEDAVRRFATGTPHQHHRKSLPMLPAPPIPVDEHGTQQIAGLPRISYPTLN